MISSGNRQSLLKSRIDMLGLRLSELEASATLMREELRALAREEPAPSIVPQLPAEPIRTRPGSVVMRKGKLLKKQIVPPPPPPPALPGRKRGRPARREGYDYVNQYDAHVRRYRKIMYAREYMRMRKAEGADYVLRQSRGEAA